ncbi:MAG: IPT/TIG domain-containing protein, partial [Flavobacterium nitrogenifigens]|uniref:IPT/TIG domain-containing protein n=1 Tax=Flavobacterium nitrogenifigens TaxID=1617283 RepID=UPI002807A974
MKYLLSILTLSLLVGCSGTNEEEVQNPTPETPLFTIQSISTNSANIGDTITIKGENFNPNAAYTVTFNGTNAQIVQITSVAIRVIVPAGTTPGPLIVASEGTTANAGYVSIIGQNRLFAYKREIIELNSITGAERKFFVYNTESDYLTELEYFAPTHEIIGQGFSNGNGNTYRLFKVKLADKTITETAYKGYD